MFVNLSSILIKFSKDLVDPFRIKSEVDIAKHVK